MSGRVRHIRRVKEETWDSGSDELSGRGVKAEKSKSSSSRQGSSSPQPYSRYLIANGLFTRDGNSAGPRPYYVPTAEQVAKWFLLIWRGEETSKLEPS